MGIHHFINLGLSARMESGGTNWPSYRGQDPGKRFDIGVNPGFASGNVAKRRLWFTRYAA
jgi:hypothetical protein